jgi:hypothetical protein
MSRSVEFQCYFFWSITQTVRFYAHHGESRVRRAVTRIALEERAGSLRPLRPADLERAFEQYREEIERIAAEKILAGHLQGGWLVVTGDFEAAFHQIYVESIHTRRIDAVNLRNTRLLRYQNRSDISGTLPLRPNHLERRVVANRKGGYAFHMGE